MAAAVIAAAVVNRTSSDISRHCSQRVLTLQSAKGMYTEVQVILLSGRQQPCTAIVYTLQHLYI
jgi:hypothetical protein